MSTGFTFGAKPSEAPSFGSQQSGSVPFGAPAPAPTALQFPSSSATAPAFGRTSFNFNTPPPQPGLNLTTAALGASTGAQNQNLFATSTAASAGFTLGTPASTNAGLLPLSGTTAPTGTTFGIGAGTGFNLSTPVATKTTSSFGLGVPATSATPSLGFPLGGTTTQPIGGLNFSSLASTTPSLSLNVPKPGGLSFGPPTTATSTAAPLLASTAAPSFNLANLVKSTAPASSAAPIITPSTGLSFGTTTASTGLSGLLTSTTTTASFNILPQPAAATTAAAAAAPSVVGLGGISATPPKAPTTSAAGTEQSDASPREQPLPNELMQTVESFKKYVQEQKTISSEISRFSMKDLKKVESDIDLVNTSISDMESELQKNKALADKLKYDTAQELQHIEMAQRTFETPPALQYDNTAPLGYFLKLCDGFERDMYALKVSIENVEKCIKNQGAAASLTSQDLAMGMRRLHETFVALAGRLQSVHGQVETQKEQYLNLRRQLLNDSSNVFESQNKELHFDTVLESVPYQPPTIYTGPTPFSSLGNSQAQALAQNGPPPYPGTTTIATPTPGFSVPTFTSPLFGSSAAGSSLFNASSGFHLQKPPTGSKRKP